MKILQINNYHYLRGGSERVYLDTSILLKDKGHQVINFSVNDPQALSDPHKELFITPIDYNIQGLFRKMKAASQFIYSTEARNKLESLIKRSKPDIAHLHIFYGRLTSSILPLLKKYRIPCVMTVHEYRMLCPVSLFLDGHNIICEKCASGNYWHCLANICNRRKMTYSFLSALECYVRDWLFSYEMYIDKFIMVSDFIANKHVEFRPLLKTKIVRISNFIDVETIEHSCCPDHSYLYLGRISREKGILTLLEACEKIPQMNLNIVGEGELRSSIERIVAAKGLSKVKLLGHLSGDALTAVLKKSRYVVLPSQCYENNPMSIIEAHSFGKPVIGANIGGIPEMIEDRKNGFLFQSGNVQALVSAINASLTVSTEEYKSMCEESRRYAFQHYNISQYYEKLMKVYYEVIHAEGKTLSC